MEKKETEKEVNKPEHNSCRYCPMGMGKYKIEANGEIYYVCEKHKKELKL